MGNRPSSVLEASIHTELGLSLEQAVHLDVMYSFYHRPRPSFSLLALATNTATTTCAPHIILDAEDDSRRVSSQTFWLNVELGGVLLKKACAMYADRVAPDDERLHSLLLKIPQESTTLAAVLESRQCFHHELTQRKHFPFDTLTHLPVQDVGATFKFMIGLSSSYARTPSAQRDFDSWMEAYLDSIGNMIRMAYLRHQKSVLRAKRTHPSALAFPDMKMALPRRTYGWQILQFLAAASVFVQMILLVSLWRPMIVLDILRGSERRGTTEQSGA